MVNNSNPTINSCWKSSWKRFSFHSAHWALPPIIQFNLEVLDQICDVFSSSSNLRTWPETWVSGHIARWIFQSRVVFCSCDAFIACFYINLMLVAKFNTFVCIKNLNKLHEICLIINTRIYLHFVRINFAESIIHLVRITNPRVWVKQLLLLIRICKIVSEKFNAALFSFRWTAIFLR